MALAIKPKTRKILRLIHKYLLIFLGCAILAFGDVAFLVPLHLVTGGVASVGIIADYFAKMHNPNLDIVDIVTWGLQVILLIVSFIFLGKKFTLHTLVATIAYPLFMTLFYRLKAGEWISSQLTEKIITYNGSDVVMIEDISKTILAGVFGGVFVGIGVGITYLADGSTGGFDVISVIIAKHSRVKESLSAFIIDGTLVIIGIICMRDIAHGLIGILSAFACALSVQYIYVRQNSYVIADVVSSEYEKIMEYVHTKMDRATTVIDATGGYTGEGRKILRVAFSKRELADFKDFIAATDPRAFVTFVQASMINGEGFDPLKASIIATKQNDNNQEDNGK